MLSDDFSIRAATTADIPTLVDHRRRMFSDVGYRDEVALASVAEGFAVWVQRMLSAGEYHAFLAESSGAQIAGGAGLWLMDWPPHIVGRSQRRANILNVYTMPAYRRRGIARRLTQACLDYCSDHGFDTVILHASAEGRALYTSMGFQATNEMRLLFK